MKLYRLMLSLALCLLCAVGALWAGGSKEAGSSTNQPAHLILLTWNIPSYGESIKKMISEFEAQHPNTTVAWVDKKGTDWPTYFQTQLAAGTPPDVFEIQGALWVQYAAEGALLDLNPYLDKDPSARAMYEQHLLSQLVYQGKHYMVPFFIAPTALFYNKTLFKQAGIAGPPQTLDELVADAKKLTQGNVSGFLTLNFDWSYWPLFRANGVQILTPDNTKAAFDTPAGVQTLQTLADLTKQGVIDKISWTGRWIEPNNKFATGNVGMFLTNGAALHVIETAGSSWVNTDTLGIAPFPGGWEVPNFHALGIAAMTKHPELAWELTTLYTGDKWGEDFIRTFTMLSGNQNVNKRMLVDPQFKSADPLRLEMFNAELPNFDRFTGNLVIAKDAQVKAAVYAEFQKALLGQTPAKAAIDAAASQVNHILAQ